jgi:SAM-dependent methyltransferase
MKQYMSYLAAFGLISVLALSAAAQNDQPARTPDVPYVPTTPEVVDAMLKVANVKKTDIVYDLGSGDGRIVIAAAKKYGARGVGVDINPTLVEEARKNAKEQGVSDKVSFTVGDIFDFDFSEATVVTLYLLPSINLKLRPILMEQLKPGTRVVSHAFSMGDWKPEKTLDVGGSTVYFWTIPERPKDSKP